MKQRFLLFVMTALLSVGAWAQSLQTKTLFEESKTVTSSDPLTIEKSKLQGARVGSQICIYLDLSVSDSQWGDNIIYYNSGWYAVSMNSGTGIVAKGLLDATIVNGSEGLTIKPQNDYSTCTVTKVTLSYNGVNLTSNFGANMYDNNNGAFQLKKSVLTNASEGDILQVSVSSEGFNDGWHMLSLTNGQGDFESMGDPTEVYNAVPTSTEVTLAASYFSDITIGSLLTFNTTVDGLKAVSGETTLYDNMWWCQNQTVLVTYDNINTIKDNGIIVTVNKLKDDSDNANTLTVKKANPNGTIAYWGTKDFSAGSTVNIPLTSALLGYASEGEQGEGNLYLGGYGFTASSVDLIYKSAVNIAEMSTGTVTADKTKALEGETVTLTVTPNGNYELGTLTVTDATGAAVSTSGSNGTYSFTMPATAVTVSATFTKNELVKNDASPDDDNNNAHTDVYTLGTGNDAKTLTVSVEKTEVSENNETSYKTNGTISASATTSDNVTTVTLTPAPDEGYKLNKLIVEKVTEANKAEARANAPRRANEPGVGNYVETTKVGDNYTFTMPVENVIVTALFAENTEKPVQPTMTYDKATRTITITNKAGSAGKLHYKLNSGDEQTTTDASASKVITVNTTVTAWITNISDDNDKSDDVEETFYVAAQPTVTYTDGDNKVSLSLTAATETNTADATLYYTTDGTPPTTESIKLTANGTIDITEGMTTIKVLALDADGNYSEIVEQTVAYAYYLTASKEWTTYYNNYSKTFSVPDGLKAYTVTSVTAPANGVSGTIEVEERQVIAKNTPMLIYNQSAGTTDKYRVTTTTDQTITEGIASAFKGVATDTELTNDGTPRYVLVDGVFLRTTGGTLPANRCYLEFGSTATAARRFSIAIGGNTTAIETVGITPIEDEGQWYDLQGRRVMQPQKGIYIRNGKKVVVR